MSCVKEAVVSLQQNQRRNSRFQKPLPPPRLQGHTPLLDQSTPSASPRLVLPQLRCPRSSPEWAPPQVRPGSPRGHFLWTSSGTDLPALSCCATNVCVHTCLPGAVQSYTWSLTYTVTTAGGSTPEAGQQLSCMRSSAPAPPPSSTHRMPVYPHREEHG